MFKLPISAGDGYVTEDTGHLWTYDGDGTDFDQA
jgi:hypothetical protein